MSLSVDYVFCRPLSGARYAMELKRESDLEHRAVEHIVTQTLGLKEGTLLWRTCKSLPSGMLRPHVVQSTKTCSIFMGGGYTGNTELTRSVFKYDYSSDVWSTLPITPCHSFGLAIIKDLVTVIGGINIITAQPSKTLFSFVEDVGSKGKWCSLLPPMESNRSCCSAVVIGRYLVVIGGVFELENSTYQDTVEILDIEEEHWYLAPNFPKPVTFMSSCASEDRIFLTGGLTTTGAVSDVFSGSIIRLIEAAKNGTQDTSVWEVITQTPFGRSGCGIIHGTLVVFGGMNVDDTTSKKSVQSEVFAWNNDSRTWIKLGDMPAKRSSLSVVVTGPSRVMIFGGYNNPLNWTNSLLSDVIEVVNI